MEAYEEAMMLLSVGDEAGVPLIRDAAEEGNPYAMNIYAQLLKNGDMVDRDVTEAHRYFLMSAVQGVDEAQYYVGMAHFLGVGTRQSYRDAIKWFRIAAEKGFPKAQFAMGECYLNGYGVYKDPGFAKLWFTMAADKEYSNARIALGDLYMDLHNPERDYKEGARLYKLAADAGNENAYYKMGMCYRLGKGVSQSHHKALHYFELGSKSADRECIFMIGVMYDKGQGVKQDRETGREMIVQASQMGSIAARNYLKGKLPPKKQTNIIVMDTLDTPDVVAGFKGADDGSVILGFLRRKKK